MVIKIENYAPSIATIPSTNNKTGNWRTFKPIIQYEKCIRCMICWKFCPEPAIHIIDKKLDKAPNDKVRKFGVPVIDYDYCKGCGICANECPVKCINMVYDKKE